MAEAELLLTELWARLDYQVPIKVELLPEQELKNLQPCSYIKAQMKTQGESGVSIPVNIPFL